MTKTWKERIAEARERGKFTREDIDCAASWSCCPVGENAQKRGYELERCDGPMYVLAERVGSPYVHTMSGLRIRDGFKPVEEYDNLGCDFVVAVESNNFDKAENLLAEIDARSDEALTIVFDSTSID